MTAIPWLSQPLADFTAMLTAGRMPHAVLVGVDEGLGAASLLGQLAQTALCTSPALSGPCGHCKSCQLFLAGNHPDFYPIKADGFQIKIDQIRELIGRLSTTAQQGGRRVAVIEAAERMNTASANALLKTLEEPGANTLIILHSNTPTRLLPTLQSRCQKLAFVAPNQRQIADWLTDQGLGCEALWCLPVVGGPIRLAEYLQNNYISVLENIRKDWRSSLSTGHLCASLKEIGEDQITDALKVLYVELMAVLAGAAKGNPLFASRLAGLAGEVMAVCHTLSTMPSVNYLALCQKIVSEYQRIKEN
ncbi:DNA polymerase III subunit delta' [Shewanella litorisediminis]|uniref:DNA-directed DNA polymerase n=1 Tax=Shewanella litorisediminis TaxID=1173586 RepID=A0ABX7FZ71_9GAMM|nr:DNA polymerase III subunit delta' [Shewanella litorisediminis]QRH00327.1 DNA polymerase III subunit delta' [Shewanella litorisediminis]